MKLSTSDRVELWSQYMSDERGSFSGVTKQDLRAAADAIDDWLDGGTILAAINSALPPTSRSALTIPQRIRLVLTVLNRRLSRGA